MLPWKQANILNLPQNYSIMLGNLTAKLECPYLCIIIIVYLPTFRKQSGVCNMKEDPKHLF